jgi:diguanylate cyclase (GGDEF)-like protein
MLVALQAVVGVLALVLAGIASYCWPRRRDERACRWLPQATVTPTVMVLVGLGIAYGLKDTPVGLMVLVTLLLARALFGLQPLKPALYIAAAMVLGAEAAQRVGLMAYAPLILAPVYDGTPMAPWWALWTRAVFDASMVSCAAVVFFMFGALARRRRELEHLVRTDMLTGLANRRTFMSQLEIESHRHARTKRPFCLVMCDIDHFKKINDTWGHPAGDAVLVELGRVLRSTTRRQIDTAARIGGEEFAVLLPETDLVQAQHVASMMSQGVRSQIFEFDGQQFHVTQSVGIAEADGGDGDGAFRVADDNLYEAKRAGRDRIVASLARQA